MPSPASSSLPVVAIAVVLVVWLPRPSAATFGDGLDLNNPNFTFPFGDRNITIPWSVFLGKVRVSLHGRNRPRLLRSSLILYMYMQLLWLIFGLITSCSVAVYT